MILSFCGIKLVEEALPCCFQRPRCVDSNENVFGLHSRKQRYRVYTVHPLSFSSMLRR